MALFRILAGRRPSDGHPRTGRGLQQPATTVSGATSLMTLRPVAGIQRVDRLGPVRRRVDDPVLGEVVKDVLGQLLALGGQPVLHLALVGEQDLLHPPQDHFVCLNIQAAASTSAVFSRSGSLSRRWLP